MTLFSFRPLSQGLRKKIANRLLHLGSESLIILMCQAGGRLCAFSLSDVLETMRMLPLERVATDSIPALCGLSLIRGEPCPVLDLGRLLGEPQQANRLVLLRVPGSSPTEQPQQRRVALAVSEVIGVSRAERSTLAELPPLLSAASADVVESLSVHDQQLVSILKTASLWSEADWAALEAL